MVRVSPVGEGADAVQAPSALVGSRSPTPAPPAVSRVLLEYDGARFAGWAWQPNARTVQAEVERALAVLLRRPDRVPVTVAGRTDAGVHAFGQVCSYDGPPVPVGGLNALLPPDVAALSCEAAPPGFDARGDATSRAYCYRVLLRRGARTALQRGRVLQWGRPVDVPHSSAAPSCSSALTTSRRSRRPTPSTCGSRAPSSRRAGGGGARRTSSSSGSRRMHSCAT